MKKTIIFFFVFVLAVSSGFVFAADKGLHLGGLDKEARKAQISSKKAAHQVEKDAKKASKESEKAKKKAAKELEKEKKKAEKKAKKIEE